jgi:hypothetical protein
MKNIIGLVSLFCFMCLLNSNPLKAQVVVNVRPLAPTVVVKKPIKARRGHTWIPGHWRYSTRLNRYAWYKGSWQRNRSGHHYVSGRWVVCAGGHKWVAGGWKSTNVVRVYKKPQQKTIVVHRGPRRGVRHYRR